MLEMLLVLPLLMLIVGLMFYVGRGMARLQHAQVMSRYESWRVAARVPDAIGPHADNANANTLMNQTFYSGRADSIRFRGTDAFPSDAQTALRAAADNRTTDAGDLAGALFNTLPNGRTAIFETDHRTASRLGRLFDGPLRQQHTRMDHEWRFANGWRLSAGRLEPAPPHADNKQAVRDVLFDGLDLPLDALGKQGNDLAAVMRDLYMQNEQYRGPTVEAD